MSVRDDLYRGKGWEGSTDLSLDMGVAVVSGMQPIGTMAATILVFTACRSRNGGDYYKYINCLLASMMTINLFFAFFAAFLPKRMAGQPWTRFIPTFSIGLSSHASRAPCRSEYIARRLCADLPLPVFAASGEYQIGIGSQTIDDPPCPAS